MKKQDLIKIIAGDQQHILKQRNESKFKYNIKRFKYFIYLTLLKIKNKISY